ncbi:hypothetical protein RRG08_049515 [Elysia crispata]|uniref:Uncharacterized protein n=1 Tax=Elysia crispata TaxID=231223 RepID=A0AAE0ZEL4_9GAST|nr:hypothetical protein RRG08_049515 [Elysia crispata]
MYTRSSAAVRARPVDRFRVPQFVVINRPVARQLAARINTVLCFTFGCHDARGFVTGSGQAICLLEPEVRE